MFDPNTEFNMLIEPEVRPYRGPILFDRSGPSANDENVFANAGFTLVDTGQKKLLITCCHVWDGFLEERLSDRHVRMLICLELGKPVIFNDYAPIDQDKRLDLITFDMTPLLSACRGRKFYAM